MTRNKNSPTEHTSAAKMLYNLPISSNRESSAKHVSHEPRGKNNKNQVVSSSGNLSIQTFVVYKAFSNPAPPTSTLVWNPHTLSAPGNTRSSTFPHTRNRIEKEPKPHRLLPAYGLEDAVLSSCDHGYTVLGLLVAGPVDGEHIFRRAWWTVLTRRLGRGANHRTPCTRCDS